MSIAEIFAQAHQTTINQILPIQSTLSQIEQIASGQDDLDLEAIADLGAGVFDAIVALSTAPQNLRDALPGELIQASTWARVSEELPGHLILTWLDDFVPVAAALLELGGAIDLVPRAQGRPPRRVLNWQAIADLIVNPPARIAAKWRFGNEDFDADGFLKAFALLIYAIGPIPRLKGKSEQLSAALGNHDAPAARSVLEVAALGGDLAALQAMARLDLVGVSEAGASQGPAGLALVPTISGLIDETIPITEDIDATISANGSVSGGIGVAVTPSGLERIGTASGTASISLGLAGEKSPAQNETIGGWFLIGAPDRSHLRVERFAVTARASVNPNDVAVTIDMMDAIALHVTGGEDGLLSNILGDTTIEVIGGLSAEWSTTGGWVFDGGVGLEVQIPIGRSIGPLEIDSITLFGGVAATGGHTGAAVTGSMALGPLHLSFDEIGVIVDLAPLPDGEVGSFGPIDVSPRFKPPSGYGAGLDFAPITGGGYIQKLDTEYRGALALQFEKFGLSAFAILNTELPGGQPGFSFAASVFATFNLPLAAGFFLTGVGGMLGINRTVDTDAMRDVLFDGRLDDLLFPTDPIAMAPRILEDMATILPAQAGQHFMGPVARISWGQPTLVHITLGVIIEVGPEVRLVILGGVKMALPTEDAALVIFNLQFMGEIDFSEGRIDFDATLEGSRVLIFTITGDAAIRTGWGPGINQIVSLGGLHPNYPKPDNLPDLRRLGAGFGRPGDRVSLSIAGYFAQTLTSVQFGARATMVAEGPKFPVIGKVSAEGTSTVTASATDVLRKAIEGIAALEAVDSPATGVISFRSGEGTEGLIDPLGRLRLMQTAVPLGLTIEKLGEADVEGTKSVDIAVFQPDGTAVSAEAETGEFVRGHYFDLSRSERLRAPAMETHRAGQSFNSTGFDSAGDVISDAYDYEVIEIGISEEETKTTGAITSIAGNKLELLDGQFGNGRLASLASVTKDVKVLDAIAAPPGGFVVQSNALAARDAAGGGPVLSETVISTTALSATAQTLLQDQPALNAQVVDYLSAA